MVRSFLAHRAALLLVTTALLLAGCLQGGPEEAGEQPTVVREVGLLGNATGDNPFRESIGLTDDVQSVVAEVSVTNLDNEQPANATVTALVDGEVVWTEEIHLQKSAIPRAFNETRSEGGENPRLDTEDDGPDWAQYLQEDIAVDGSEADEFTLVVNATSGDVVVDGWLRAKAVPGTNAIAQADHAAHANKTG